MTGGDGLIARAQAGDREALGELLVEHHQACYALALRLTGHVQNAEDVCQDAFVRASRDVAGYRPTGGFRSWLFALVVHAYGDRLDSERARRRREEDKPMEHPGTEADGIGETERADLRRSLDRAMSRLDDSRRIPLILRYEQGMTAAEAAAVLVCPVGTVRSNIHRGLEELRGLMARAGYGALAVGTIEAALAEVPAAAASASLAAFVKSLTSEVAAKTAGAGTAATGLQFVWKVAAGLVLAAVLGLGGREAWKRWYPAAAPAAGQAALLDKPVTLHLSKVDILEAMAEFGRQTGLRWATPPLNFHRPRGLSLECRDVPARKALDELAAKAEMTWRQGPNGTVLLNFEDPDLPAFVRDLKSPQPAIRIDAARALHAAADLRAFSALAIAFSSERDVAVRQQLATTLHFLMSSPPLPRLQSGQLRDGWKSWLAGDEKRALVTALLPVDSVPRAGPDMARVDFRAALLGLLDDDPRALAETLKGLDSQDRQVFRFAASAAGSSGNAAYADRLIALVRELMTGQKRMAELRAKMDRLRAEGMALDKKESEELKESISDLVKFLAAMSALRGSRSEAARKLWFETGCALAATHSGSFNLHDNLSGFEPGGWTLPPLLKMLEGAPNARREAAVCLVRLFKRTGEGAGVSERVARVFLALPEADQVLAEALGDLAEAPGREALIEASRRVDGGFRSAALAGLARWSGRDPAIESAILGLAPALPRNDLFYAMSALGKVGGEKSVDWLKDVALREQQEKDQYVGDSAIAAIRALGDIGGDRAVQALRILSGSKVNTYVAGSAGIQLLRTLPPAEAARSLLELAGRAGDEVPEWNDYYRSPLMSAGQTVAAKGGPEIAAALRRMAADRRPTVRAAAARAMGAMDGDDLRADLFKLAGDECALVRAGAVQALDRRYLFGSRRHVVTGVLREMWKSGNPWVRHSALSSMGRMSSMAPPLRSFPGAIEWMLQELKNEDSDRRRSAARHLRLHDCGDPRVPPALAEHARAFPGDLKPAARATEPRPETVPLPAPGPEVF